MFPVAAGFNVRIPIFPLDMRADETHFPASQLFQTHGKHQIRTQIHS